MLCFLVTPLVVPTDVCSPLPRTAIKSRNTTLDVPQGDVIYLHEPLLWALRQHATNGVSGPDSLARAIGAVALPLLEITARVGESGGDAPSSHGRL